MAQDIIQKGTVTPAQMPTAQRKKILIIEDDPFLSQMYFDKFVNEDFEVFVAHDGLEGLKMVNEKQVDLVILDILIPKLSGVDLLTKIKEDPKTKALPIIALTNLTNVKEEYDVKNKGVNEYLIKSDYTPSQVVEIVKKHLPS